MAHGDSHGWDHELKIEPNPLSLSYLELLLLCSRQQRVLKLAPKNLYKAMKLLLSVLGLIPMTEVWNFSKFLRLLIVTYSKISTKFPITGKNNNMLKIDVTFKFMLKA